MCWGVNQKQNNCAKGGTRTPTSLRTQAPEACASTSSATFATPDSSLFTRVIFCVKHIIQLPNTTCSFSVFFHKVVGFRDTRCICHPHKITFQLQ